MSDQPAQGPIYEYMMGTFDLQDATWIANMNDMLNNFGLAGWRKSVATLLDARHLLVVMERRWPSAAEYPQMAERQAIERGRAAGVPDSEVKEFVDEFEQKTSLVALEAEASEYDDEAEAMMAAKVAEVIPWAARPKAPANGRRKGAKGPQRKKVQLQPRNKAAT